jgi:hypothetical protein
MPIRGRRNRRFVVEDATVEYRKHSALPFLGGSPRVSPLINLSVGGLQFVSADLYEPGQRLDLKVMIPSAFRALSVRGEVVWAKRIVDRDTYRTGVHFLEPSAEDISLLRSLEERYWAIADERKREMEELIARRYPLHREPTPEGEPARVYEDAAEQALAAPPGPPPQPMPVAEPLPAAQPAPGPAPAPPPPPPLPVAELLPQPAEEPAEAAPKLDLPIPIPLYDLVAGLETRADAGLLLQGVPKCQIVLPGITDRDCFALEIHDNTMRHSGTPSFDRGDVVVFSPNVPARSGDLAFVITHEGGIFRQIFFDANNTVRLRPLNSWYPEQRFHRGEVQGLWKLIAKFESFLTK